MYASFRTKLSQWAKNPVKTYLKLSSIGFGGTFASNIIWSSIDSDAPLSIRKNPEMYTSCLLAKSITSGLLWPAIPFRIYQQPRRFFCVGAGIQEDIKNVWSGEHSLSSIEDFEQFMNNIDSDFSNSLHDYIHKGLENGSIRVRINGEDATKQCLTYFKKDDS